MTVEKMDILLNACKQSDRNDSSKLDHLATAMGVAANSIENVFIVQEKFDKMGAGFDPIFWLEY
jgi:hypothetical protein